MFKLKWKSQKEEKTQKKRQKRGGKRVKTPIEKPSVRDEAAKVAIPKQRSIVRAQKPEVKRTTVTPMDVAKQMKTQKGGKKK